MYLEISNELIAKEVAKILLSEDKKEFINQITRIAIEEKKKETELFYSVTEIANMLEVNRQSVLKYIESGELKAIRPGKKFFISQTNYNNFLNNSNPETANELAIIIAKYGSEELINQLMNTVLK